MGPVLVDTAAAAEAAGVQPITIRLWHHRGYLHQHGHDHAGRGLYDLAEVYRCARARRERAPRAKGHRPVTSREAAPERTRGSSPTYGAEAP